MSKHDEDESWREIVEAARRVPPASPDLDRRIMAAVRSSHEPRWRRSVRWFTAPRTVSVSPAAAVAYAAGLVALVLFGTNTMRRPTSPERPMTVSRRAATGEAVRVVRFVLMAPEAKSVALVGDFNRWSLGTTPLRPVGVSGMWAVDVPLMAGRHEYAFVIDGTSWVADPVAPRASLAEFGVPNSVITVIPELS